MGGHTIKIGYDWRSLRQKEVNNGWQGGAYGFDGTYTRATSAVASQYGQGIAVVHAGHTDQLVDHRNPRAV